MCHSKQELSGLGLCWDLIMGREALLLWLESKPTETQTQFSAQGCLAMVQFPVKIPSCAGRSKRDWFAIISYWPKASALWFEGVFDLLILQETGIDNPGDFKGCSFNQTPPPCCSPWRLWPQGRTGPGIWRFKLGPPSPYSLNTTSFVTAWAKLWEQQFSWLTSLLDVLAGSRE